MLWPLQGQFTSFKPKVIKDLHLYCDWLLQWNKTINLIAHKQTKQLWLRHIEDSAQLFHLVPKSYHLLPGLTWVDIGSGGGFPSIVLAIMAKHQSQGFRFHLIESHQRKASFLAFVIRNLGLNATVYPERIEKIEPKQANIVTARALSELDMLLFYAHKHLMKQGVALFPKGVQHKKEIDKAKLSWRFKLKKHKSEVEAKAVILQISKISKIK